ncbi:MAG TPA: sensor histidine kinase [Gammaproteobacteria bacterium]|nr:sensor histidine kinase [Gammaproteobacteria bacterium]
MNSRLETIWRDSVVRAALGVHRLLLPQGVNAGWLPYLWLPYLGFLFMVWFYRPVSVAEIIGTSAAVCVFLALYFRSYAGRPREMPWLIAGIAAIGLGLTPFNIAAGVFFIYAAAICGYAGLRARNAVIMLIAVIVTQVGEYLLLGIPAGQWVWAPLVGVTIGLANLYFGDRARKNRIIEQSQDEIRRLATIAERERIARDLHDLLGHTLTLITVKAELAGTLAARNMPRAAEEIRELESIARDALAQVRQAVGGYRGDLAGEIANAGVALRAAGVGFEAEVLDSARNAEQDAALAMVVREAVTNIVRHAGARMCRLSLRREGGEMLLCIDDDGTGGRCDEGNGIRGMRERLQAIGGALKIEFGGRGTCLCATLPVRALVREREKDPEMSA